MRGNCLLLLQYLCEASKIDLLVWLYLSKKEVVFWYFRYLISVQLVFQIYIFYTVAQIPRSRCSYFINKYITNVPFSITCVLEALDQQVEYSLIQTFRLLKQILRSLGCLFQRKKTLGISNSQLNPWQFELSRVYCRFISTY